MKKTKIEKIPTIYTGLITDQKNTQRCIMEDNNFVFSMFDSKNQLESLDSYNALIKPTIAKVWANFRDFSDTVNKETTLAYHENLFSAPAPKKQELITTQLWVWHKICSMVKNSGFVTKNSAPKDPSTGRKSSIGSRLYMHGAKAGDDKKSTSGITTYQALKSLELFRTLIGNDESVTESVLKQYVIDNGEVLKTKQDPWRIFQYYRPQLIKEGLIRCN